MVPELTGRFLKTEPSGKLLFDIYSCDIPCDIYSYTGQFQPFLH